MTTDDFAPWFVPSDGMLRRLGRHLGTHDPLVQRVGVYLLSSPLLHTSGHYALPQAVLLVHLNMISERIEAILKELNARGFCRYDFSAERVYVPLVAQTYTTLFGNPSLPTPMTVWADKTLTHKRKKRNARCSFY